MINSLFADVSEYQTYVDFIKYPSAYRFISIRSNDGTYRDKKFPTNYTRTKAAVNSGRLDGFIVYFVWRPNWLYAVNTLKSMVGTPHPKMAVMIDVESWGGQIKGNQSVGINAARENLIAWLGGNRKRVIGYANAGDFANLWPSRGDCKVILANYSGNPDFPGKIAHQFSSSYNVPPFGLCDINSADGYTPAQFAAALGLVSVITKPTPVVLNPNPAVIVPPEGYAMVNGYLHSYVRYEGKPWKGVYLVGADLTRKIHVSDPTSLRFLVATKLYPTSGLTDAQVDSIPNA